MFRTRLLITIMILTLVSCTQSDSNRPVNDSNRLDEMKSLILRNIIMKKTLVTLIFAIGLFALFNTSFAFNSINSEQAAFIPEDHDKYACFWWADNIGSGSTKFWDCMHCGWSWGDDPRIVGHCYIPPPN